MKQITLLLPDGLLKALDDYLRAKKRFPNRSEAIRDAIRTLIAPCTLCPRGYVWCVKDCDYCSYHSLGHEWYVQKITSPQSEQPANQD